MAPLAVGRAGPGGPGGSVVAEVEGLDGFAAQRVLAEPPPALGAEVEAEALEDVVADLVVFGVFEAFQQVLDFPEVIAVSFFFHDHGIEGGADFDLHHVAEILIGIQLPPAQIASIVNHDPLPNTPAPADHDDTE
jgi:hypothetical protein